MLILLLASAGAVCPDGLHTTSALQRSLSPATPLVLTATWGDALHLAQRIRVRGPDGALVPVEAEQLGLDVRLTPRKPWPVGRLTLEERGDHDAEGRRVTTAGEVARSAWFALQSVEVVPGPPPTLAPAGRITWSRSPEAFGSSSLGASVDGVPDGARWLAIEVEGVGPIALGAPTTARAGGPVQVERRSWRRCDDFFQGAWSPDLGDLSVRLVVHGDPGARWDGPWTTLGPGRRSTHDGRTPTLTPSGVPAGRDTLARWSPVDVTADRRPLTPAPGGCGALELVGTREIEVPTETAVRVDDRGALRHLDWTTSPLRLDGQPIPGVAGRVGAMVTRSPWVWLELEESVVAVRDGHLVGRLPLGNAQVQAMEPDIHGSLVVVVRDMHGVRTRHTLSPELSLLAQETVRHPIELDRSGVLPRLNGRPLVLPGFVLYHHIGPEHVLLVTDAGDPGGESVVRLHLITSDGTEVWTRRLLRDQDVTDVEVDDRGAVVQVSDSRGPLLVRTVQGWDLDGTPRGDWPATPAEVEPETRIPWGARAIVATEHGVSVEENGWRTAFWPLPRSAVVGHAGDTVEVASLRQRQGDDWDRTVLTTQSLRCTGVPRGVPERIPTLAPPSR